MAGVVWTPVAECELDDILFYISLVDRMRLKAGSIFGTKGGSSSISLMKLASKFCGSSMPYVICHGSFERCRSVLHVSPTRPHRKGPSTAASRRVEYNLGRSRTFYR